MANENGEILRTIEATNTNNLLRNLFIGGAGNDTIELFKKHGGVTYEELMKDENSTRKD